MDNNNIYAVSDYQENSDNNAEDLEKMERGGDDGGMKPYSKDDLLKIVVFLRENDDFQEFAFFAVVISFATERQKLHRKLDRWKTLKKSNSEAPFWGSNEGKWVTPTPDFYKIC